MLKMKYSLIIPVFNRPDEVDELLESLTRQTEKDFEVLIVEDGSEVRCEEVVRKYAGRLDVKYFEKTNSGPGQSRNYGAERSMGDFLIVLDSDVVLPEGDLEEVNRELTERPCDAFGGPDRAHESFTPVQKAINYSMTSFFTTGGIRGGKKKMDKFYPRSFNMGIRRDLYLQLGGFSNMRFGEDIDFSIRIFRSGARCRLFPEAWVWHKRRTDFRKFFRQVHNSGIARINLYKKYPDSLKFVHLLPAAFVVGLTLLAVIFLTGAAFALTGYLAAHSSQRPGCNFGPLVMLLGAGLMGLALLPVLLYALMIIVDSACRNRSLSVALLSVPASFIQLTGYGTGFLRAWWLRCICGRNEELQAFRKSFYK